MENSPETQNKKRLGRGLNSLFSENGNSSADYSKKETTPVDSAVAPRAIVENIDPESRIWKIAIDKLVPGIYQPRKSFNKESIEIGRAHV